MIGFRGASRYYDDRYREGFALECRALTRVRDEMGLINVKVMVPFCRTVEEARLVTAELARNGLARHERGLDLYMMVEIPSNVILLPDFAEYFDGFSIGSNDLTQLTLGVDRDSEIVAHVFDERDKAVRTMIAQAIQHARRLKRKIGLCGQAPSDYPDFARFLVECGIDSMSLNPDAVLPTTRLVFEAETERQSQEALMARMKAQREERSDAAVFADARKHLDDCPTVPGTVHVHVEDGLVTLTGIVLRASQRTDAQDTVRPLIGTRRLLNKITVTEAPSADVEAL
jgi:phosphoenolpyruvate-protein kinase (PTS system EI component)